MVSVDLSGLLESKNYLLSKLSNFGRGFLLGLRPQTPKLAYFCVISFVKNRQLIVTHQVKISFRESAMI
jgi:hypothetical protein